MIEATATQVKVRFGEHLTKSLTEDVIITRDGKPKYVLISYDKFNQLCEYAYQYMELDK